MTTFWAARQTTRGRRLLVAALAWVVISAALCGCPSPNTYGVPRTVPPGEVAHAIAVEGGALLREQRSDSAWPSPLVYQLRLGVHEQVDVGARVGTNASFGLDAKWNFYRTRQLDLAAALGTNISAGAVHGSGLIPMLYGHLPLLVGLNVSERVSVIASPGLMSMTAPEDGFVASPQPFAPFFRAGLGVDFRVSRSFAILPEMTFARTMAPLEDGTASTHLTFFVAGVAARFGQLPN